MPQPPPFFPLSSTSTIHRLGKAQRGGGVSINAMGLNQGRNQTAVFMPHDGQSVWEEWERMTLRDFKLMADLLDINHPNISEDFVSAWSTVSPSPKN